VVPPLYNILKHLVRKVKTRQIRSFLGLYKKGRWSENQHDLSMYIFCVLQRALWSPFVRVAKIGWLPPSRGELGLDGHLLVRRGLSEIDWAREFGEKRKFYRYPFEYLKPHPELELLLRVLQDMDHMSSKNNLRICRDQLHTVYLDVSLYEGSQ
jgi:hypothetical protein